MLVVVVGCGRSEQQAVDNGYGFLAAIQRADGAICDTVNPLFDIWETVEAASAIWACTHDTADPALHRALAFLQQNENPDGLLCHNVKCRKGYCLETTSEYFILLARIYGPGKIAPRMEVIKRLQKPSGEWEIGNPDVMENQAFPSVTGFVLAAFQAAEMRPQYPDSAWQWLLAQQNAAGNWGTSWEYYGCAAYALWPILRAVGQERGLDASAAIDTAGKFIERLQAESGAWETAAGTRKVSPALETALMVAAMTYSRQPQFASSATAGRWYLVKHQQIDGHWEGGHFPIANARYEKQEYVFATARAMLALQMHLDEMGAWR